MESGHRHSIRHVGRFGIVTYWVNHPLSNRRPGGARVREDGLVGSSRCSKDAADLESVVQFSYLDLEVVETVLTNRESIDATYEHVLSPSDTAKCPQPVAGFEKDSGVGSKVGVEHGARRAGVDQ